MSDASPPGFEADPPGFQPDDAPMFVADNSTAPAPVGNTDPPQTPIAPQQTDEETTRDNHLSAIFDAGITKAPDRWAGILGIAKKSGAPIDIVEERYDEFKQSAESAKFDPRRWRQDNPGLYSLLVEKPQLAPIIHGEKKVSWFTGMMQKLDRLGFNDNPLTLISEQLPAPLDTIANLAGDSLRLFNPLGGATMRTVFGQTKPEPAPQDTVYQQSPLRGWDMVSDTWGRSRINSQIATLGTVQLGLDARMMIAEADGHPPEIASTRAASEQGNIAIQKLKDQLGITPDYAQGQFGQIVIDATQGLGAQIDVLKGMGEGAGAGAVLAGGAALAATRNPSIALQAARAGAEGGAKVGSFFANLNQQTGSSYLEFRDTKDDQGRQVDPVAAMGAAAIYGLLTSAVSVATVVPKLQAFGIGNVAAAATDVEKQALLKSALVDSGKQELLKRIGGALIKSTAYAGGEGGVQSWTKDILNWGARSVSARDLQSFDLEAARESAAEQSYQYALGNLVGLGGAEIASSLAIESIRRDMSSRNAVRVHAAMGLAETEAAASAPQEIADIVAHETERSGQKLTHLFLDPLRLHDEIVRGGGDPAEVSRELLGENAVERMRNAILDRQDAPGGRSTLEIPMAEFNEKWGRHPIVEALKHDFAARAGDLTVRELADIQGQETAAQAATDSAAKANEPAALPLTDKHHAGLDPTAQLGEYYRDRNTQLLNERGREIAPRDPARPMAARFSLEGKKFLNDEHTHLSVDGALRTMAQAVSTGPDGVRDAAKVGGGIEADVRDQAHADALAEAMSKAIDPSGRIKVLATAVERAPTTAETGTRLGTAHDASEAKQVAAGAFAGREQSPVAYANDPESLRLVAEAMAKSPEHKPGATSDLSQAHAERFATLPPEQVVRETYQDKSGLYNELGFHRSLELTKPKHVVSADMRGIKKMNLAFGRKKTDGIVRTLSDIFVEKGGGEFNTAHLHGDEYGASGNDEARLRTFFDKAHAVTSDIVIFGKGDTERGGYWLQEGLHFAYGSESDFAKADQALRAAKSEQGPTAEPRRYDTPEELRRERDRIESERQSAGRRFIPIDLEAEAQPGLGSGNGGDGSGGSEEVTPAQVVVQRQSIEMGAAQLLFRSPAEAGMTGEQFAAYLKDREQSTRKSALRVERHLAQIKAAEATEAWKAAVEKRTEEAAREFESRPDFRAWRYLKRGEMVAEGMGDKFRIINFPDMGKLDRDAVYELLGKDQAKTLLRGRLTEFGEAPADVAVRFGFKDAKTMLDAIANVPDRDATITSRAEEMAREAHPQMLTDLAAMKKAADDALHNEGTSDWLIQEWNALKAKSKRVMNQETGKEVSIPAKRLPGDMAANDIPLEGIRKAAKDIISAKTIGRLDVGQTLNRERSAAENAALAAARGNFQQALVFKQQQLLAHFQYGEIDQAVAERDSFIGLAKELTDKKRRGALGKAGASYLDAADQLLEGLGFKERGGDHTPIVSVLADLEAQGLAGAFPVELAQKITSGKIDDWRSLTVDEMRDARKGLALLYTAARRRNKMLVDGRLIGFAETAATIQREAQHLSDKGRLPGSTTSKVPEGHAEKVQTGKMRIQALMAEKIDPEEIFKDLGPEAHRVFWDEGYIPARATEDGLAGRVLKEAVRWQDEMPAELRRTLHDPLTDFDGVEMPPDLNLAGAVRDRAWMIMVALNMGNASNAERLVGGFGWDEAKVREWLNRNMTKAHWDFVQSVLDLNDKELYPHVAKAYEEETGLPPTKIEAVPLLTPHGEYRGGYFPAKYDSRVSRTGRVQAVDAAIAPYSGARESVMKGFTKERTKNFSDVINLNWNHVPGHISQVIHYVAFSRFVRDTASLLSFAGDRGVPGEAPIDSMQTTIQRRLGAKYETQVHGWLRAVANLQNNAVAPEIRQSAAMMGWLRSNMVQNTLAYSIGAAAAHVTAPVISVVRGDVKLDPRILAPVLGRVLNPFTYGETRRFALEHSLELRHASEDVRRTMLRSLSDAGKGVGWFAASPVGELYQGAVDSAHFFIDKVVHLTSTLIWTAAYRQSLADGLDEKRASLKADTAVRGAIASQTAAEQPAFLRDKTGIGALIAFYGPGSKLYNANRSIWHETVNSWEKAEGWSDHLRVLPSAAGAVGKSLALVTFGQLAGDLVSFRGPEKDEEVPEWLLRKAIAAPGHWLPPFGELSEAAGSAVASYAFHGKMKLRPPSLAGAPALAAIERTMRAVGHAASENRDDDQRLWDMLDIAGIVTGSPLLSAQVSKTGRYVTSGQAGNDLSSGDVLNVARGIIKGPRGH